MGQLPEVVWKLQRQRLTTLRPQQDPHIAVKGRVTRRDGMARYKVPE